MPGEILEVEELTKRFGSTLAVDRISFTVAAGEVFGFLGPNGAGKTTTLKMITGLVRPTAGRALVGGFDVVRQPLAAKRMLGYVPDEPHLYGKLTVMEFLHFVGDVYGLGARRRARRIEQLIELFELRDAAGALIELCSHGTRQKVSLCAAILHEPQLYIFDEPTVGLDPKSARLLKDILREAARSGRAVLMSTHIMEIAQNICDRVAIIDKGRVVVTGSVAAVRMMQGEQTLEEIFLHLTGAGNGRTAGIFEELV